MTTIARPSVTAHELIGSNLGPHPTGWSYQVPADVRVQIESRGVLAPDLTLGGDYTLTAADPLATGGTVQLSPSILPPGGWAAGSRLVLTRRTTRSQQVALSDTEGHRPRVTERALDKQMRISEEDRDQIAQTLRLPVGAEAGAIPWAPGAGRRFLVIDETGAPRLDVAPEDFDVLDKVDRDRVALNLKDLGATGDGRNDTAAVLAANAEGGVLYVPPGRYQTTLGFYDVLNSRFTGEGQVVLDGYAQARDRSFMTSEIEDVSNDRTRVFDGDWSKAHKVRYAFRGGSLGKSPITTYRNLVSATPEISVLDFLGGTNTDLVDHAGGRTGMADRYHALYHGGQGDLVGDRFYGEVYSARAGAQHWLANPALIVENGGLGAVGGATGAFLNHSEFIYSDSGLAVTAIDRVRNYHRTNAGAGQHQVWVHDRPQSSGSVPVDVAYAPSGSWRRGIDMGAALFESGAWAATKRGDYRYMDATSTPDPLGAKFYSDDLGDTFDGIVGDAYTLALGAGVKWSVSGLSAHADDAAAGGGGLSIGNIYVNSATGALTFKRT